MQKGVAARSRDTFFPSYFIIGFGIAELHVFS